MATDPENEDADDEWRFSLSDLEDEDGEDAGSNAAQSSDDGKSGSDDESEDGDGIDAGVAGTLDVDEELVAGDVDVENALFVLVGVVLALVFVAGFLNLWP